MGEILTLVRETVSSETIYALEYLLQEAREGHVIGIAYVALQPGRRIQVNALGEAAKEATYTRGAIRDLDDQLAILSGQK